MAEGLGRVNSPPICSAEVSGGLWCSGVASLAGWSTGDGGLRGLVPASCPAWCGRVEALLWLRCVLAWPAGRASGMLRWCGLRRSTDLGRPVQFVPSVAPGGQ
jgi:hypothetical protein